MAHLKRSAKINTVSLIAIGLALANVAIADDRALFLSFPSGDPVPIAEMPIKMKALEPVRLYVVLRTRSVEDRATFPEFVVDDYRYDMPTYFKDGRIPNVRFEAEVERNGAFVSIPVTVWSSGGGVSLEKLVVDVDFHFGRDPKRAKLREMVVSGKVRNEDARKSLLSGPVEEINRPGTYRLRVFYRPNADAKSKEEISAGPINIMIENER